MAERVGTALASLSIARLGGLIVDLRGNRGGFVDELCQIAGQFLGSERVVALLHQSPCLGEYQKCDCQREVGPWGGPMPQDHWASFPLWNGTWYRSSPFGSIDGRYTPSRGTVPKDGTEAWLSRGPTRLAGLPILVLVDRDTASAAEMLAGALADWGVALIAGEPTYGKGIGQRLLRPGRPLLPRGGTHTSVVTALEVFRPSGDAIQGRGIVPHIELGFEASRRYPALRMADDPDHLEGSGDLPYLLTRQIGLGRALERFLAEQPLWRSSVAESPGDVVARAAQILDALIVAGVYERSTLLVLRDVEVARGPGYWREKALRRERPDHDRFPRTAPWRDGTV